MGVLWRVLVGDKSLWASESIETTGLPPSDGLQMPALPAPANVVLLNPYAGKQALLADKRKAADAGFREFISECETDTRARTWEPRVGRAQYTEWRRALRESGWAEAVSTNPKDGWQLTAAAQTIIQAMDL